MIPAAFSDIKSFFCTMMLRFDDVIFIYYISPRRCFLFLPDIFASRRCFISAFTRLDIISSLHFYSRLSHIYFSLLAFDSGDFFHADSVKRELMASCVSAASSTLFSRTFRNTYLRWYSLRHASLLTADITYGIFTRMISLIRPLSEHFDCFLCYGYFVTWDVIEPLQQLVRWKSRRWISLDARAIPWW